LSMLFTRVPLSQSSII